MSKIYRWVSVGVSGAMLLTLVLINAIPASSAPGGAAPVVVQNTSANPVPVDIQDATLPVTQSGVWNVRTLPGTPANAFSKVVSTDAPLVSGPDASGTSYAITAVAFGNLDTTASIPSLILRIGTADCTVAGVGAISPIGPEGVVSPSDTVILSFPQPFVMSPGGAGPVCLELSAIQSIRATVVGYKIPA